MKVYFVYEGKDVNGRVVNSTLSEAYKVKIDVPAKWLSGPCEQLLRFVVSAYTKKNPEPPLAVEELSLWHGSVELKPLDIVETRIHEYNEVRILHLAKSTQQEQQPGSVTCTNYGCGMLFLPSENNDTACHHHAEPPVFHDIEKYWRCCPTRRARDWEDFRAIPPCCTGRHGTQNKQVSFTSAPIANTPLATEQMQAVASGTGGGGGGSSNAAPCHRIAGPREFEAAVEARDQPPQVVVNGRAKCRHYGCQQEFVVDENNPAACRHHVGGPVFWDTYKYWKCCPDKKCYEFDDFVKVPGCTVGPHQL